MSYRRDKEKKRKLNFKGPKRIKTSKLIKTSLPKPTNKGKSFQKSTNKRSRIKGFNSNTKNKLPRKKALSLSRTKTNNNKIGDYFKNKNKVCIIIVLRRKELRK